MTIKVGDRVVVVGLSSEDVGLDIDKGDTFILEKDDGSDVPYKAGGHWFYPWQLSLDIITLENE